MLVMPPWPHEEHIGADLSDNPFRVRLGITNEFLTDLLNGHWIIGGLDRHAFRLPLPHETHRVWVKCPPPPRRQIRTR